MKGKGPRHLSVGRVGEALAWRYLREKKFKLIKQNARNRAGEIDLVVTKNGRLHFVEVKTVSKGTRFTPQDNLTKAKLKKLARSVHQYLHEHKLHAYAWQIDAVFITLDRYEKKADIQYLEHATLDW